MRGNVAAAALGVLALIGVTGCVPEPEPDLPTTSTTTSQAQVTTTTVVEPGCVEQVLVPASATTANSAEARFSADSSTLVLSTRTSTGTTVEWRDLDTGERGNLISVPSSSSATALANEDGTRFMVAEVVNSIIGPPERVTATIVDRSGNVLATPTPPAGWFVATANEDLSQVLAVKLTGLNTVDGLATLDVATQAFTVHPRRSEHRFGLPPATSSSLRTLATPRSGVVDITRTETAELVRTIPTSTASWNGTSFLNDDSLLFSHGVIPTETGAAWGSAVVYRISTDSFDVVAPPSPGARAVAATLDLQRVLFVDADGNLILVTPAGVETRAIGIQPDAPFYVARGVDRAVVFAPERGWVDVCLG